MQKEIRVCTIDDVGITQYERHRESQKEIRTEGQKEKEMDH